jgi:hypothetical protein
MSEVPTLPSWDEFGSTNRESYHGAFTVSFMQLMDDEGFAAYFMGKWAAFDAYDEEQRERLLTKFHGRFDYREIGLLPVRRWTERLIAKLNEIMPKYKPLYQAIADGVTTLTAGDEWHKRRDAYSSFPQTRFASDNQDYATSGTDLEYETVRDYGLLDVGERIADYNDVDVMILNELETLFVVLKSSTLPYL